MFYCFLNLGNNKKHRKQIGNSKSLMIIDIFLVFPKFPKNNEKINKVVKKKIILLELKRT